MDKLEGLEEGDTVEVTFRGTVFAIEQSGLGLIVEGGSKSTIFARRDVASPSFAIKKVEPPIAVGDRVSACGQEAEVRAIVDGFYVVNSTAWAFPQVWRPEGVKRA